MQTQACHNRLRACHLLVLLLTLTSCADSVGPGSDRPEIELLPTYGATAGSSGFTLMVHGHRLREGSVVQWNGTPRSTQFIDSTRLAATITAADVAVSGTIDITVQGPGGRRDVSAAKILTVRSVGAATASSSRVVALPARDLVHDATRDRLYASMPGHAATHANSIVEIDGLSGAVTRSTFVGSEPDRLAISDNAQYLYVGLNGANAVRRIELAQLAPGLQWSLPPGEIAGDINVAPGEPNVVAVARYISFLSPPQQGVTIYDAGIARPVSTPSFTTAGRIEFLNRPTVLYGFNNAHTGFEFYTIAIAANGATHSRQSEGLIYGFFNEILGTGGRIYATGGEVVDAERHERVGSFAGAAYDYAISLVVDTLTGRVFMLSASGAGIHVYDSNTYQKLGTIPTPAYTFDHPGWFMTRIVRWGQDGLAFLGKEGVFLVRSPIVAR